MGIAHDRRHRRKRKSLKNANSFAFFCIIKETIHRKKETNLVEKQYCCWCEQDLEVEIGRMVWLSAFDEHAVGHRDCVEQYDKQKGREETYNTPRRNEFIEKTKQTIQELKEDLKRVSSDVSHSLLSKELQFYQVQLKVAQEETFYDVIMERLKEGKRRK